MGTKQTRYLVMGTPFLLNEMIAGRVPGSYGAACTVPWLASWSPRTPRLGLPPDVQSVFGERQGETETEVGRWARGRERGAEVQPLRRERRPGPGRGGCQREEAGAEKMVETEQGGREHGGRPAQEEAGLSASGSQTWTEERGQDEGRGVDGPG